MNLPDSPSRSSLRGRDHFPCTEMTVIRPDLTKLDAKESSKIIFKILPPCLFWNCVTQPWSFLLSDWFKKLSKKWQQTIGDKPIKFGAKNKSLNNAFDIFRNKDFVGKNHILVYNFWLKNNSFWKKLGPKYWLYFLKILSWLTWFGVALKKMIDYIIKTSRVWREQREKINFCVNEISLV